MSTSPRFITFDCASTLVEVRSPLIHLLGQAAEEIVGPQTRPGLPIFGAMTMARLGEFHEVNLRRDPEAGRLYWVRLAGDWLERIGEDRKSAEAIQRRVDELAFGSPSLMFSLYEDTIPCLQALRDREVRLAIISNWDYTLHRVVQMLGLAPYFDVVIASLEEGTEKPDPRLFEIALSRLGAAVEETVHVGDDPLDDITGAQNAGMRGILLDRSGATGDAIRSLADLEGLLWNA